MKAVLIAHRWGGAIIGLFLLAIGLTGAVLLHRDAWISWSLPEPSDRALAVETLLPRIVSNPDLDARFVILPSDRFAHVEVRSGSEGGAYLDPDGTVVARWSSRWERPEHWLFDIHATLLNGEPGELVAGLFALAGLMFVVTGVILWWRTRRTFEWRLWPRRLTRPAIIRHHRDLGIVVAPSIFLSLLTGAAMAIKPVGALLVMPLNSPAELQASLKPPAATGARPDGNYAWATILPAARAAYPDARLAIVSVPKEADQALFVRMAQPSEWTENGRTMLWFHPNTGELLKNDNGLKLIPGMQAYFSFYPLHTGEAGGILHRWLMTLSGLALALLGSLAVWSFWRDRTSGIRKSTTHDKSGKSIAGIR
jgi:uncharacterized iron-regulated membrane protein